MYPFIYLGPTIQISTYNLILSLDFCLCLVLGLRWAKTNGFSAKTTLDLGILLLVSGFIGARLAHVLYESPLLYINSPLQIFYFWQGGFVYYGGFIAAIISAHFYLRVKRQNTLQWLDVLTPILSFGYALGRLACFMAGCCYGKTCDLPWAVSMVNEQGSLMLRHPTQLYLSLWELAILVYLIIHYKLNLRSPPPPKALGSLFFTWLPLHSAGRFIVEFYRDDFRGIIFGLSISGWLSALFIIISLVFWTRKNSSIS